MKTLKMFMTLTLALAMFSCGENKQQEEEKFTISDNKGQSQTETSAGDTSIDRVAGTDTAAEDAQSGDQQVVEIKITGNDQMQFNKEELRVQAGQTVRLTLEHTGQLPKTAMGHNVVILKQGTDVADFAQKAAQAGNNEYIPENTDQVIVHTELIGGGETTTIEFEAPEAGTYTFICSFPGHYIQMQGQFIVE